MLVDITRDWEEEARFRQSSKDLIDFYTAEMSSIEDGLPEILRGAPFVAPYAAHRKIAGALVLEVRHKRVPGSNFFKVEVEYSTEITQQVNPLSIPPIITGGAAPRSIVRLLDVNGKPKINTAGDIFDDPPPEVTIYDRVYKVQKNLPAELPEWVDDYANCVNEDDVVIKGANRPAGTLLYLPGEIGQDELGGPQGNIRFCNGNFELHYRADGWTTLIPNRGFNEIVEIPANYPLLGTPMDAKSQTTVPILPGQLPDDQVVGLKKGKRYVRRKIFIGPAKEQPTEPQMLDKKGRMIAVPTIDNIIILEFDDHEKRPFNGVLPLK